MRAGSLRQIVTIQARSTSKDSFGQQLPSWSTYLSGVPAEIQALSGRELIAAQAVQAEVTHQITLRYHPMLADPLAVAAMRIVYINGAVTRYFNISAVMNIDERNRQLELMAAEGLNQA
jgi:SPP1 family predicted phage head-tail adaptor